MMIYGHRGAKGEAPENTLEGFINAYGHGLRRFEMDIQLSSDGEPVVIHDTSLERTTGHSGQVSRHTAAAMNAMDTRHHTRPWPSLTGVPTLYAIVEACPEFEHLQLEVKSGKRRHMNILCNRLVEWIQKKRWHQRITLTSSDTWFLKAVKRRSRQISTGFVADRRFPNPVRQARQLGCNFLIANHKLCSEEFVASAQAASMHVSCWTVNSIHDMLKLEHKGVDSIITDYPTSAMIYFENRVKYAGKAMTRPLEDLS